MSACDLECHNNTDKMSKAYGIFREGFVKFNIKFKSKKYKFATVDRSIKIKKNSILLSHNRTRKVEFHHFHYS